MEVRQGEPTCGTTRQLELGNILVLMTAIPRNEPKYSIYMSLHNPYHGWDSEVSVAYNLFAKDASLATYCVVSFLSLIVSIRCHGNKSSIVLRSFCLFRKPLFHIRWQQCIRPVGTFSKSPRLERNSYLSSEWEEVWGRLFFTFP